MTSITIPVDVLKAALAVMPKNEIRYYLNGLHINAQGRWLEATDGLIALRIPLPFEPPAGMNNVIVPREAVERMVNVAKADGSRIITLRQEGGKLYRANMGAQDVLFGGMNAQFPDMDRVFTQNYYPIPVGRLPYCLDAKLLAKQYTGEERNTIALYEWIHDVDLSSIFGVASAKVMAECAEHGGLMIPTLEGNMLASKGDWIIRGVQGEFYPCKPDIFTATYEPVED